MITESDEHPDYLTTVHVPGSRYWVIRHLRWDARADDYSVIWQSPNSMPKATAGAHAKILAAGSGVEYRP